MAPGSGPGWGWAFSSQQKQKENEQQTLSEPLAWAALASLPNECVFPGPLIWAFNGYPLLRGLPSGACSLRKAYYPDLLTSNPRGGL